MSRIVSRRIVVPCFRLLIIPGAAGMLLLVWGLVQLDLWLTIFGATLVTLAQLWRIDQLGRFYEEKAGRC